MPQHKVEFEQFFAAPRARVFDFFADHERFSSVWWPARGTVIRRAGGPDPNAAGSVRELRVLGVHFQETITDYRPHEYIEYRVTQGGPFKNHLGRMRFTDVPGGSQLNYSIEFDSRWPLAGNLVAGTLCATWHRGIGRVMDRLMAAESA